MQHRAREVAPGVAVVETAVVNAYLVGDAQTLAEHWDVPVHTHCLEWPFLTGAAK